MKKFLKILGKILVVFIIAICLFLIYWFYGDFYKEFSSIAKQEYPIPGFDVAYSPQGLTYVKEDNLVLISGYMSDNEPSRIYVIDKNTNQTIKYFTLKYNDKDFLEHAGGIATNNKIVWIAGTGKVYTFPYEKIATTQNGGTIDITSSFDVENGTDFLTIEDDNLWIGEFYLKNIYDTKETHQVTKDKETNYAISFRFKIDNNKETGVEEQPNLALSTTNKIQGMIITEKRIIFSTSYALPNSHIYYYNNILNNETDDKFDYKGTTIPLYFLSKENIVKDLETPSMSEEIDLIDGRVHILYENNAKKYRLFTREKLIHVYSVPVY